MKLFCLVVIAYLLPALAIAASAGPVKMSLGEMLIGAGALAAAGGIAASFRIIDEATSVRDFLKILMKTCINTTVFGLSFGLIAWYLTSESQVLAAVSIGLCGLLSLGGLLTVEWGHSLAKRWIQARIDERIITAKTEIERERERDKELIRRRLDEQERRNK